VTVPRVSKHRVAVLKIVTNQLSVTAAAAEVGLSRGHLHRLLRRYREGGLEALEPHSRRPRSSPGRTPEPVRERIVALRTGLTARGLDAGPVTIAWHLGREGLPVPSTSTVRRVLHAAGLVIPEPRKRPRSSWLRFEAAIPKELWQSDVTHWRLADGTEVEICSWLDDHARYRRALTATSRAVRIHGSPDVTATVCSKCADRLVSRVTAVHPSASTFTAGFPAFTMGSIASTMPSASRGPWPGSP